MGTHVGTTCVRKRQPTLSNSLFVVQNNNPQPLVRAQSRSVDRALDTHARKVSAQPSAPAPTPALSVHATSKPHEPQIPGRRASADMSSHLAATIITRDHAAAAASCAMSDRADSSVAPFGVSGLAAVPLYYETMSDNVAGVFVVQSGESGLVEDPLYYDTMSDNVAGMFVAPFGESGLVEDPLYSNAMSENVADLFGEDGAGLFEDAAAPQRNLSAAPSASSHLNTIRSAWRIIREKVSLVGPFEGICARIDRSL